VACACLRRLPFRLKYFGELPMRIQCLLLSVLVWATTTSAQETELTLRPAPATVWEDTVGAGFRENSVNVGLSLGGASGVQVLGGTESHDFFLSSIHVGWVFSKVRGQGHWYRGNWELRGEVFGGEQFNPHSAYIVGLAPLFRYDFATGTRWLPFVQAGGGVTATDIGPPDLSTGAFQFNIQMGAGLHYFVRDNLALTLEYRALHISNAHIESPDLGVNCHAVLAGVSWWF
jgi:lipid A 3-O-deacylase